MERLPRKGDPSPKSPQPREKPHDLPLLLGRGALEREPGPPVDRAGNRAGLQGRASSGEVECCFFFPACLFWTRAALLVTPLQHGTGSTACARSVLTHLIRFAFWFQIEEILVFPLLVYFYFCFYFCQGHTTAIPVAPRATWTDPTRDALLCRLAHTAASWRVGGVGGMWGLPFPTATAEAAPERGTRHSHARSPRCSGTVSPVSPELCV